MKKNIICIVGATASGKTTLSIELAKKINAEIISVDSMQIYKNLNIGTAKVTQNEMKEIPHHMIDICNIEDNFSVADYKNMCYDKIESILSKDKNVILVGGTGLYINAIINNMNFEEEEIDFKYRESLYKIAKEKSNLYVYEMLEKIDPVTAKEIHPNNLKRVIRALEIAKNSNRLKSKHMENEQARIKDGNSKYNFFVFYIDFDRDILYERINKRVDLMINSGLVEEAKMLYDKKLSKKCTCIQAIGYKELFKYFDGILTLEEAIEKLKQNTRRYAKRQKTWFKNKLDIVILDGNNGVFKMIDEILEQTK